MSAVRIGGAWLSPDCTQFSRAKGAKPLAKNIRALASVAHRWASEVRPRMFFCENVPEFLDWGPLDEHDRPIESRKGETFAWWCAVLRSHGYELEWSTLIAADYGAPTSRKRLFVAARCDGARITWPRASHGPGLARPHRTAAECIRWDVRGASIFGRKRSPAPATLARIAIGVRRFVVEARNPSPFIVRHGHYSTITGAGLREGCGAGTFRGQPLDIPLATVCATNDKHLICPIITKHYGGVIGHRVDRPLGTITAKDHHALTVARMLAGPEHADRSREVAELLRAHGASGDDVGLVTIDGEVYRIVDIESRMLIPPELFAAQGFPDDYVIDGLEAAGKPIGTTAQTKLAGNAVPPPFSAALVAANLELDDGEGFVDMFAGGGGTSTGVEEALGRSPDAAINHDEAAIVMHAANHPASIHYREDVFDVNPHRVVRDIAKRWAQQAAA